jgi:hypothetical protein
MPSLQNLDSFNYAYVATHKYKGKYSYSEPLLDKNLIPEPIPSEWYNILKKNLLVRSSSQYEDPSYTKKIVRKYGVAGTPLYHIQVLDKDKNLVREIECGRKMPSTAEAQRILHVEIRQMQLESYEQEQQDEIKNVSQYTELTIAEKNKPRISLSQQMLRSELDEINEKYLTVKMKKEEA